LLRGNFVFFETGQPHEAIAAQLINERIEIARAFPPFDHWVRISIGLPAENVRARGPISKSRETHRGAGRGNEGPQFREAGVLLKRRNIPASLPYDLVPLGQIRNFSPVARRLNATIISGESTSASDISDA
jgi:hypothetical protein